MNKKLLVVLTVILVLVFAVPAFANLTGLNGAKNQPLASDADFVCGPYAYKQACGGDPAVCAQGGCDQADCPNAGLCGTGAACDTGSCATAVQQGYGGGGCGGTACAVLQNGN